MESKMKNFKMLMTMLVSSVVRRRSRILVALLAIAIGATVLLGMVTIYYDIPLQMGKEFRSYGANMVLVSSSERAISHDAIEGAVSLIPRENLIGATPYRYEYELINSQPVTLAGTDFTQAVLTNPFWQLTGELPADSDGVVMGMDIAAYMNIFIGEEIELENTKAVVVVRGIVKTGSTEDNFVFIDINALKSQDAEIVELSIAASGEELKALSGKIEANFPEISARLVKRVTQSETAVLTKLHGLVYLVTIVVLILTMITVATTMLAVVFERRREIGLKKAIGAENASIAKEFLGESILLGFAGGLLGSALGFVFAHFVSMSVFGRSISIHLHLITVAVLVSIAVTVLSSLIPVRMATSVEPAIVLRGE